MAQKAGYDIAISFVAPTFDRDRIEQVVRHLFGAENIAISIELHQSEPVSRPRRLPKWEPKPGTGAAELLDLVRAKGIVRSREFKHVPNARAALELLLMDGHIEKVRHGIYRAGGLDKASQEQLGRLHPHGSRQQQILEMLAKPHTAGELRDMCRVSRQAIDQLLKKLMKEGLVRRLPAATETASWLYIRSGQRDIDAFAARTPSLTNMEEKTLNLLPPTGGARATAVVDRLGPSVRVVFQRLSVKGLIEDVGTPKRRILRLTRKGLQHPAYVHDGEHLPPIEETAAFKPALVRLMIALDALGEARAIDLTDVSRVKAKGRTGTGQYMQWLRLGGYIEQVKIPGSAPVYRLTKQGAVAISSAKSSGRAISPAEALRRLTTARQARTATHSERQFFHGNDTFKNSRTPELLSILARSPALTAPELHNRLSQPFSEPRSIYTALRDFERRGWVEGDRGKASRGIRWSIAAAGTELLERLNSSQNTPPA